MRQPHLSPAKKALKPPQHRADLDWWRGLAIMAVIVIHTIDIISRGHQWVVGEINLYLLIDQIGRFCVPLFVAISGYVLTLGYSQHLSLTSFFKKRIVKLIPAYVVWSVILYYALRLPTVWYQQETLSWWQILVLGRGDYHLYFVPMIIQLYLLFPVLVAGLKRWPQLTLAGTLIIQTGLILLYTYHNEVLHQWGPNWSDMRQYFFFGTWLGYFGWGAYLAQLKTPANTKFRVGLWLLAGLGLVWTLSDASRLAAGGYGGLMASRFTRLSVMAYTTGLIGLVLTQPLTPPKAVRRLTTWLGHIGQDSYYIYLMHTLVMRTVLLLAGSVLGGSALLLSVSVLIGCEALIHGGRVIGAWWRPPLSSNSAH